ncbi:MAG: transcriptional regulator [Sphingomonas bacterium]|uniref:MucR family transcriptional regulator n=1 Tax=Sphingomonas bacterium TaxID=1895847 RepID=UPI0026299A18|nr:MucR family transcriptional regulator [Sphingomonas bacterium]MDB5703717.1 transcriptional regulator [Sphingomonas bacterium]
MSEERSPDAVTLATDLTIAWLGNANTRVSADDVPAFLKSMFDTVSSLGGSTAAAEPESAAAEYTPAVTARKSLGSPEHIISMIDGKPYKTLRRHLSGHGLTPEQYRERYNLKADYPMVAPAYSTARREMAKKIGLGRKLGQTVAKKAAPAAAPKAPGRPRAKKTAAEA